LVVFILANIYVHGHQLLQLTVGNRRTPGGFGESLRRFREVETVHDVDILFQGSSHAYRGFDTRIFTRYGLKTFNLGSTSQTPLNSYYLLEKYLKQIHPKLIVFEVYPVLLGVDGIESFFDLAINLPLSKELAEMAIALKNPQAVNSLLGVALGRIRKPLTKFAQQDMENELYIPGGYCQSFAKGTIVKSPIPKKIEINESQLHYVDKVIRLAKRNDIPIVLITQPIQEEYRKSIINYDALSKAISLIADANNVNYIDYNYKMYLDSDKYFLDKDHLSQSGVEQFNARLLKDLLHI
jgi:hypothetical protein